MPPDSLILLTGATGYVGGRLCSLLERRGCRLRCLARRPQVLAGRVTPTTEVVAGDVLDPVSLLSALRGVHTAYYLVHALGSARGFEEEERTGARNFADAAREAGVQRIVYLGGLAREVDDLSPHMRTRLEVGRILRDSGVPTVEFRASIVLGSGSLSFEMIRALVERLPVMVTPRWVRVPAQPIAIDDLLQYLVAALQLPAETNHVFEIGGADRASYGELMHEYARQRGLKRFMVPVPVLTPRLSGLWLGLVTPLYARIGRKLIEGLQNASMVEDETALTLFPIRPRGMREAMAAALRNEDREIAETRWHDAISSSGKVRTWAGVRFGNRLVDARSARVSVSAPQAFRPIARIGGENGWYAHDWLWRVRGFIDLLWGGVGLRRGRSHPSRPRVGDAIDFWRVEAFEPDHLLRLAAEMKLPGRAWLEWRVEPSAAGSTIHQTAIFDPVGLSGIAYWYALYPVHRVVFSGLIRGIVRRIRSDPAA